MSFEDDFDDVEEVQPHKFQDYFKRTYKCKRGRNDELLCKMDGEVVKIPNSVRQMEFNPERVKGIEKFVKHNHEISKRAGLDYTDKWYEG